MKKLSCEETYKAIKANKVYFDNCLNTAEELIATKNYGLAANYLDALAKFNWGNITGYYTNWRFEKQLNTIGANAIKDNKLFEKRKNISKIRILHIASELYNSGGHTRLLMNWINNDPGNLHNVVVTRQVKEGLPFTIIKEFSIDENIFSALKEGSILDKAIELNTVAKDYDIAILHCHPDDIIPVIAFSSEQMPTLGFMNNNDNQFWAGASICDLLIQFREPFINLDIERRDISNHFVLNIPLTNTSVTTNEQYLSVRKEMGIQEDEVMLLSAGTEYKYEPDYEYNFFETVFKVLNENRKAKLYIAGVSNESALAIQYPHDRIKYLGTVTDLYKYEEACDIYLDGFPHNGPTAMLETGIKGKCVHLIYNPYEQVVVFENVPVFKYQPNEKEWINELNKLIADRAYRNELKEKQLNYLQTHYSLPAWKSKLKSLYDILLKASHSVNEKNISRSYAGRDQYYLFNVGFGKLGTDHFLHCYHLRVISKIKHATYIFRRPPGVGVGKRALLKFIFS